MTRDLREALRIPAGSRWNIGLKSASFAFVVKCSIAKRETFLRILFLWSRMDVMYFTRRVVAWHATCQSPIGSYRLLGGNMLTRGILTRGIF
jgi:hypothetical protein